MPLDPEPNPDDAPLEKPDEDDPVPLPAAMTPSWPVKAFEVGTPYESWAERDCPAVRARAVANTTVTWNEKWS